jgi:hypothetical protein
MSNNLFTLHHNTARTLPTNTISCLQIEQTHGRVRKSVIASISFFWCLDFLSTYSHNKTTGNPNAKNTIIVRSGILRTNRDIPNNTVPIPRTDSQRLVKLSGSVITYLTYGDSLGILVILILSICIRLLLSLIFVFSVLPLGLLFLSHITLYLLCWA